MEQQRAASVATDLETVGHRGRRVADQRATPLGFGVHAFAAARLAAAEASGTGLVPARPAVSSEQLEHLERCVGLVSVSHGTTKPKSRLRAGPMRHPMNASGARPIAEPAAAMPISKAAAANAHSKLQPAVVSQSRVVVRCRNGDAP